RAHQVLLLAAHGEHHDRHVGAGADRLAHLEARQPRHVDVEHDEVRALGRKTLQRPRPVRGLDRRVAGLGQRERDQFAQVRVVIRDQHLHAGGSAGSVTLKRVRPAAVRSKATLPPWRSTIDFTSHRPRPSPAGSGSLSPRRKRANSASPAAAAGPAPSSSTQARTAPSPAAAPMRTTLPSGANLLALASRFTNTWVSRVLSPRT